MSPENYNLTTDYATIKNDGFETFTLTIPGSQIVADGATRIWSETKIVGTQGGFDIMQLTYTGRSDRLAGPIAFVTRNGTLPIFGTVSYDIRLQVSRSSPSEITAYAEIFNGYGSGNLTTNASPITFTFYVTTFLPPF